MHAFPPKQSSDMMRESSKNHLLKIVLLPNKHYNNGQNSLYFMKENGFHFKCSFCPMGTGCLRLFQGLKIEIALTHKLGIFHPTSISQNVCILNNLCTKTIYVLVKRILALATASEMRSFSIIQTCTTFRTNRFALQGYQNFMTKNFRHISFRTSKLLLHWEF